MADKYYLAGSFAEDSWKVLPENEMTLYSEDPLEYKIVKELPADSAFKFIGVDEEGAETWYTANSLYTSPTHAAIRRNYYHKFIVPASYQKFIICRMNPGNKVNDWSNKWNQTSNLVTGEGNIVDVTGWEGQNYYANPDYPSQDANGNYIVWVNIGPNWGDQSPRYAVYCFTDGAGSEWFDEVGATSDNVEVTAPDTYTIYFKPAEQHVAMIKYVDSCNVKITTNNGSYTAEGLNEDGTITPGGRLTLTFVADDEYSLINPTYSLTVGGNPRGFSTYDEETGIAVIEDVSGDLELTVTFNYPPLEDGWYLMSSVNDWSEPVAQMSYESAMLSAYYRIPDDVSDIEFKVINVKNHQTHWLDIWLFKDENPIFWEAEWNGNIHLFNPQPEAYRYIRVTCYDVGYDVDWDDPSSLGGLEESWYEIEDCTPIWSELYNCTIKLNDTIVDNQLPLDISAENSAIITVSSNSDEPIEDFEVYVDNEAYTGELIWNEDHTEVAFEIDSFNIHLIGHAGEIINHYVIEIYNIGAELDPDCPHSVEEGGSATIYFTPCQNALDREFYIAIKNSSSTRSYNTDEHVITLTNVNEDTTVYITPMIEAGYYLCGPGGGDYAIPATNCKMDLNPSNPDEHMLITELQPNANYTVYYMASTPAANYTRFTNHEFVYDTSVSGSRPDNLGISPAWMDLGFTTTFTEPTKVAIYAETKGSKGPGTIKYYIASNYPVNKTNLHGCTVSPNVDFVDVDSTQTFTITSSTGSELSNIRCTVDGVEQDVVYSDNKKTATITIPNVRGDIIMSGTTNADKQFILMHPVNNGIMDQNTKLYPYTVDKIVEFDNTGTTIQATNVHDAIIELSEREPNPDSPVNPTPTPTSTGTIDFDGMVSGSLNGFNSPVYKFCTNGTTGAGDNEITIKWTQNAQRTISMGRLSITSTDSQGVETVDEFDLTEFQGTLGLSHEFTIDQRKINWSLSSVEANGAEVKTTNENKTIGEETRQFIKIGTTKIKVTEITLSTRDYGGRNITSVSIETYGSSSTNAVLTITVGGVDFEFAPETTTQTIAVFGEEWPSYTATGEVALETGETTEYTNVFIRKVDDALETLEPVSGTLYYNINDKDLYQWRNEVLDVVSPTLHLGTNADQAYKGSFGQTNYMNINALKAMIGSTTEEVEGDEPQTITTIELKGTKIKVGSTVISEEQLIALLALLTN